jgi:hypothetical protein
MLRVLKDSFNNRITERQAVTTRGSLVARNKFLEELSTDFDEVECRGD